MKMLPVKFRSVKGHKEIRNLCQREVFLEDVKRQANPPFAVQHGQQDVSSLASSATHLSEQTGVKAATKAKAKKKRAATSTTLNLTLNLRVSFDSQGGATFTASTLSSKDKKTKKKKKKKRKARDGGNKEAKRSSKRHKKA